MREVAANDSEDDFKESINIYRLHVYTDAPKAV